MQSPDGNWSIIPAFDTESAADHCYVTGLTRRDTDIGVFRPMRAYIEFEGFPDLSQYAIEQAAQLLGWASPEGVDALRQEIADLKAVADNAKREAYKHAQQAVQAAAARAAKADA